MDNKFRGVVTDCKLCYITETYYVEYEWELTIVTRFNIVVTVRCRTDKVYRKKDLMDKHVVIDRSNYTFLVVETLK